MESKFLSYKAALRLKELGFDEACFAIYEPQEIGIMLRWVEHQKVMTNKAIGYVLVPLYQQAFKWLLTSINDETIRLHFDNNFEVVGILKSNEIIHIKGNFEAINLLIEFYQENLDNPKIKISKEDFDKEYFKPLIKFIKKNGNKITMYNCEVNPPKPVHKWDCSLVDERVNFHVFEGSKAFSLNHYDGKHNFHYNTRIKTSKVTITINNLEIIKKLIKTN